MKRIKIQTKKHFEHDASYYYEITDAIQMQVTL
jgi:hypothetical protein